MYKFSPKVAHVPNGPIDSPSPSPSPNFGLLDLLNAMNRASLPTVKATRRRNLTRQLRMSHILNYAFLFA